MYRRKFLGSTLKAGGILCTLGLFGCGKEETHEKLGELFTARVVLYDTYAMALYMDGSLGPKTGVLKVDYVLANQPVDLEFWHGHGGKNHRFTVTPDHFKELKKLKKVLIETTRVADHTHKLFIDPSDPKWRVAGAPPVEVPDP